MREALARIDNDYVFAEPKRSRTRDRLPPPAGFFQKIARTAHFMARHANLFVGLLFVALLGTVLANALLWQKARHPAPLFGNTIPLETKARPQASAEVRTDPRSEVPVPAPAPRAIVAAPEPVVSQPEHAVAAPPQRRDPIAAELAALQQQKPAAKPHDSIAQLLHSSAPTSESGKSILAAQRALMKLGYVVKTDGVMSPETRQALKQFEKDRKLPVQGTLSAKVMHSLSSESGISVQ